MEWLTTKTNKSAIQLLRNGYRNAVDILYPHRCPICETIVDKEGDICRDCGRRLRYITEPFCMICSKPLGQDGQELCGDCMKRKHRFVRGVAALAYTKELKDSIYRFKYAGMREYAAFYGEILYRLKGHIIKSWRPDVIMPVPLHASRFRKRGYNQAELIAAELGRRLAVPVDDRTLIRCVNTVPQKDLDNNGRAKNTKKAFQVNGNIVQYKRILLVDDIYTTGATIDACAAALTDAGTKEVFFASVCVGRGF